MAKIAVLDQNTINKIAAGEVIERPASVVKELVENAIDAGSNAVTIEIKEGGCSFIRITDNGAGIPKDQIQIAFLRHSTSKIKSVEDLFCVSSLGFRGEALSSIAAVAQVELITKTADSLVGSRYLIDGGCEKSIEEIGCPDGTTFIIRNLFYNTPVRRKFLKSNSTEAGYISDLIEKLSLSHPEISFRFINGGQNKLYTSGNGQLKDVIYGVYGRDITSNLLDIHYECDLFTVDGYIGKPMICRGNRALENYYINGRYIKSSVISKGIEDAYSGFTMPKKYPFTSLHFNINPELIDINVHPTKMELRFSKPDEVYKAVYDAVYQCLSHRDVITNISLSKPAKEPSNPSVLKESSPVYSKLPEPFETKRQEEEKTVVKKQEIFQELRVKPEAGVKPDSRVKAESKRIAESKLIEPPQPIAVQEIKSASETVEEQPKFLDAQSVKSHKILGQLFETYWLVEFEEKLYIIDQHAAHEKVLYERYLKNVLEGKVNSQMLMPPKIVSLTLACGQVLMENINLFTDMGFEIESYGGNEYAIYAVPMDLYGFSEKDMLLDMLDELMQNNKSKATDAIKDKIATMACKAAVKGNNKLSYDEIKTLINELLTLDNPYNCPHGRPTMISISKYELEKKFKRII